VTQNTHALVGLLHRFSLQTKCEVPSFSYSRDMIGAQNVKWVVFLTSDHACFRVSYP